MERRTVGTTDLEVTRFGLGTAPLGGLYSPVADEDAFATMQQAWDDGIRFFDTAPQYGNGLSERRLGEFLRGKPRADFVIATKVGRLLRIPPRDEGEDAYYKGTPPERPVFDFSYDGVMRSFEESLQRLSLDRIDILHIHDPDNHYPEALAGAYKALDRLRGEKVIKAVGAGMNQSEMLTRFAREGRFDCFLLAGRYTLLEQRALDEFLPLCLEKRISVFAGGVYNSGLLANPSAHAKFNYEDADAGLVARAQELAAACARHGVPLKAAAVQFPLHHPAITAVLIGPRNPTELADSAGMSKIDIPRKLWAELQEHGLVDRRAPVPR
ncbi:aldo/keto reductase [Dongia sedimenti]|uniref:Aldo/keto reductase n=1 Tax=Dongia sedimenti TaxID=3064282 RepID=A0ABU0YQP3_9PROT|nr:aldo/keto reductase [Rhodospirillaceae bacterium R-7]